MAAGFSLWTHFAESTVIAQAEYLLLAGMSLGSWSVIFWKIMQFRQAGRFVRADLAAFRQAPSLAEALAGLRRAPHSPSLAVAREAVHEYRQLERLEATPGEKARILLDNVRFSLRDETASQVNRLGAALQFLAMCASAGPLLGLFGTVWGIFISFQGFVELSPGSMHIVGKGLAEALGTTIAGMLVAIPAVIANNLLLSWLWEIEADLGSLGSRFLFLLRRELGRSQPASAADLPHLPAPPPRRGRLPAFRMPGASRPGPPSTLDDTDAPDFPGD